MDGLALVTWPDSLTLFSKMFSPVKSIKGWVDLLSKA